MASPFWLIPVGSPLWLTEELAAVQGIPQRTRRNNSGLPGVAARGVEFPRAVLDVRPVRIFFLCLLLRFAQVRRGLVDDRRRARRHLLAYRLAERLSRRIAVVVLVAAAGRPAADAGVAVHAPMVDGARTGRCSLAPSTRRRRCPTSPRYASARTRHSRALRAYYSTIQSGSTPSTMRHRARSAPRSRGRMRPTKNTKTSSKVRARAFAAAT